MLLVWPARWLSPGAPARTCPTGRPGWGAPPSPPFTTYCDRRHLWESRTKQLESPASLPWCFRPQPASLRRPAPSEWTLRRLDIHTVWGKYRFHTRVFMIPTKVRTVAAFRAPAPGHSTPRGTGRLCVVPRSPHGEGPLPRSLEGRDTQVHVDGPRKPLCLQAGVIERQRACPRLKDVPKDSLPA